MIANLLGGKIAIGVIVAMIAYHGYTIMQHNRSVKALNTTLSNKELALSEAQRQVGGMVQALESIKANGQRQKELQELALAKAEARLSKLNNDMKKRPQVPQGCEEAANWAIEHGAWK